jgi:hypothetical protein
VKENSRDLTVHVVEIASLEALVKESSCSIEVGNILVEDEVYCLELKALDEDKNEIILTDDLKIKVVILVLSVINSINRPLFL